MKVRIEFSNVREVTTVTFTERIDSAIGMLTLMELLEVQQETTGVWDGFVSDIRDVMDAIKVTVEYTHEFFKGHNDVIFELKIHVSKREGCIQDLTSEQVMGTILSSTVKHFNWRYYQLMLTKNYDSKDYANLMVFNG
jgi:hypothetical protein